MIRAALLLPLFLGFCQGDETLTGHGAAEKVFTLRSINGEPFNARATITFPEEGKIAGQGPCNSYSAIQEVPYPWFKAGPILATKRACPDLDAESLYFKTLSDMTLSEVSGIHLILSTAEGEKMEFEVE
ncbi:META domain-containing protein [uncultured Litoreibacter sp.]|uniref:META domain-containing protein n=1 Tax=uncultured Litoreibacter sp. TaxID=1392394 RepID=UPI002619B2A0|nr:META domain-containing protein [uncultured Litoreibacter sp.]